eukprot:TRINITY_DN10966_c0_g2_i2.p4 TRINITY_DN10966_c0_g2~~TRINITY_DN10966_c0_g2_i2.p4  ORF type:complete len:109 (-),score=34.37 TRINITY_DN10966_c0_g2_i2:175-501(-)
MIRRPPRSTHCISSAASDVYKRQVSTQSTWGAIKQQSNKIKQNKINKTQMDVEKYKLYGSWTKTIRYYNDMSWYYLNIIQCLPIWIVAIYRLIMGPKSLAKYLSLIHI